MDKSEELAQALADYLGVDRELVYGYALIAEFATGREEPVQVSSAWRAPSWRAIGYVDELRNHIAEQRERDRIERELDGMKG